MKKYKLAGILMASMMASSMLLGACGGGNGGGGGGNTQTGLQGTLTINVFNGGYGTAWLESAAKFYESKHKEVTVKIKKTVAHATDHTKVESGIYVADIFFDTTNITGSTGLASYVDLADVYTAVADGTTETVAERLGEPAEFYKMHNTGAYYDMPILNGASGLLYNKTSLDSMLGSENWEVPRTSDEMYAVCQGVIASGNVPFIYTPEVFYEQTMLQDWWLQLMGVEAYDQMSYGKYHDETSGEYVDSKTGEEFYNDPSRLVAIEEFERFMNGASGMTVEASKTIDFVKAQAYFWGVGYGNDKRKAAFMVNGDWMYSEMQYLEAVQAADIRMCKTPVISSIIGYCEKIETDAELSALVKAMDEEKAWAALPPDDRYVGEVSPILKNDEYGYDVSEADWWKIYEARHLCQFDMHQAFKIPKNAKNYELAKDFLVFMTSDAAGYIISENLNGMKHLYNSKIEDLSVQNQFIKSRNEKVTARTIYYPSGHYTHPISALSSCVPSGYATDKIYSGTLSTTYIANKSVYLSSYKEARITLGWEV